MAGVLSNATNPRVVHCLNSHQAQQSAKQTVLHFNTLAGYYLSKGDHDLAETILCQAEDMTDKNGMLQYFEGNDAVGFRLRVSTLQMLSQIQKSRGRLEEAVAHMLEVHHIEQHEQSISPDTCLELCNILLGLGRHDHALNFARRTLNILRSREYADEMRPDHSKLKMEALQYMSQAQEASEDANEKAEAAATAHKALTLSAIQDLDVKQGWIQAPTPTNQTVRFPSLSSSGLSGSFSRESIQAMDRSQCTTKATPPRPPTQSTPRKALKAPRLGTFPWAKFAMVVAPMAAPPAYIPQPPTYRPAHRVVPENQDTSTLQKEYRDELDEILTKEAGKWKEIRREHLRKEAHNEQVALSAIVAALAAMCITPPPQPRVKVTTSRRKKKRE